MTSKSQSIKKSRGTSIPQEIERKAEVAALEPAFAESSLRERAMLARFSIGRWYATGADDAVTREIKDRAKAEGDVGCFSKRLMRRERLAGVNRVTAESRKFHKAMTLPWGDSGARLLSVEAFRLYKERMSKYEHDFNREVEALIERFPEFVQEERRHLGALWRESDYPTAEQLRERFRWALAVEPLPDAQDIRLALSKEHAEEIRQELQRNMHSSLVGAVKDIYGRLGEQVRELRDRLGDVDASLRRSLIDNLQEQLMLVPKLNILHDPSLTKIAAEIQRDLVSLNLGEVKEDKVKRAEVEKKATRILDVIGKLQGAQKWTQEQT